MDGVRDSRLTFSSLCVVFRSEAFDHLVSGRGADFAWGGESWRSSFWASFFAALLPTFEY